MRQFFLIGILAALAISSFLLMRGLEQSLETAAEDNTVREIATAYEINGRFFGADNQLKYQMHSPSVSEFSSGGGMRIKAPSVSVFDADKQLSWQGRANVATLTADKNTLTLAGDVELVESPNTPDRTLVNSERMVYDDNKREVVGDQPVTVVSKGIKQSANRFRFDVGKKTLMFEASVKASYAGKTQ